MLGKQYLATIRQLIDRIESEQYEPFVLAAKLIADGIAAGGALHRFDTGHMREEPIERAGGLFGIRNIELQCEVNHIKPPLFDDAQKAKIDSDDHAEEVLARHMLRHAHIQSGDVLIVISNSGKTGMVVETALAAKKAGLKIIAITAVAFSRAYPSLHSSGKRLFEVADVTIDNGGESGDAALRVPGLDNKICPTSGVMGSVLNWVLTAEIVEQLLARDIAPEIYRSINLPDGAATNAEAEKRFNQKGI